MAEILVVAEHRDGALRPITAELCALARRLGEVTVLLPGAPHLADDLPADRVLLAEDPELASFDAEPWLRLLGAVVADRRPSLVLLGHTTEGMDLAPALAAGMGLPLVTDCLALELADAVTARRVLYGGKIEARLELHPAPTVVATVRPGSFGGAAPGTPAVEAVEVPDLAAQRRRRFVRSVASALDDVDIAGADFLVSVGRGVGKPENVAVVQAFADAVGAVLSCSRPVADRGWLPKSRQVGTSGKTVRPRVYLALGISGAYQHVAGMSGADTIIAVNSDPDAPIFEVAHLGITDDLFRVLPVLQAKLEAAWTSR